MAEKIKRKIPIQWIQSINEDGTYEFYPDPNVYSTQKNVPSTSKIDLQSILIDGTDPTNSLSSSYATSASFALTASFVQNAISSSFSSTASFTLNAIVTASVSSNKITFTKGNGTTFPITVNTGSGGGGATSPGGSTTEMQYNNAGTFGGTSALTFDGTTITANPIIATGYFIPQNAIGGLSTVGADYTITEPGIYRFTSMDSGGARFINFPNPTSKPPGQTIIIINSDALYAGYYDTTNSPESSLGVAITLIGAGIVDTFVNIDSKWIRTARRP